MLLSLITQWWTQLIIRNYMQNTSKILTGLFQLILTIDHTWFNDSHQSALLEPKQVFLLYISTKVTYKNTSLNYSDSWYLISQTCFHCKTCCASLFVPPVMQYQWRSQRSVMPGHNIIPCIQFRLCLVYGLI